VPTANLLPVDGVATLAAAWLAREEADRWFALLVERLDWQQEQARFGAKCVPLPRLTAWYGDVGYQYSGVYHPPQPWPAPKTSVAVGPRINLTFRLTGVRPGAGKMAGAGLAPGPAPAQARRTEEIAAPTRHN